MSQRTALVTGSAQGIGLAIAEALRGSGHRVLGVDIRDSRRAQSTQAFQVDLSDPAAIERLIAEAGPVDVLVNNAAVLVERTIDEHTVEDWDLTMNVNLRAPFLLSRGFGNGMRERRWGRIVNIASIAARTGGIDRGRRLCRLQGRPGRPDQAFRPQLRPRRGHRQRDRAAGDPHAHGRGAGARAPGLARNLRPAVRAFAATPAPRRSPRWSRSSRPTPPAT